MSYLKWSCCLLRAFLRVSAGNPYIDQMWLRSSPGIDIARTRPERLVDIALIRHCPLTETAEGINGTVTSRHRATAKSFISSPDIRKQVRYSDHLPEPYKYNASVSGQSRRHFDTTIEHINRRDDICRSLVSISRNAVAVVALPTRTSAIVLPIQC
jgi:hypothetical protein